MLALLAVEAKVSQDISKFVAKELDFLYQGNTCRAGMLYHLGALHILKGLCSSFDLFTQYEEISQIIAQLIAERALPDRQPGKPELATNQERKA